MDKLLTNEKYGFIDSTGKEFILAFDKAMTELGYTSGGNISDGYCWGRYMIIYTKEGVKSKKSYARVYMRDGGPVLRMYFSNIDGYTGYIEQSPQHIKDGFTADYGVCGHCHNQKGDGACSHRKSYTLGGTLYEKCDGFTFEFQNPTAERIPEYLALFEAFYPRKRTAKA